MNAFEQPAEEVVTESQPLNYNTAESAPSGHEVNAFGSVVETPKAWKELTPEEQMAQVKLSIYKRHGVTEAAPAAPTMAELIKANESSKMVVHQDGSITCKKGIIGNDSASKDLMDIIKAQTYAKYGVVK